MSLTLVCAFICLGGALLSLWIKKDPKIWGILTALSLLLGVIAGYVTPFAFLCALLLAMGWIFHYKAPNVSLFTILIGLSLSFKLFCPGFIPFMMTSKFGIGLKNPLLGLFPLALFVPVARGKKDVLSIVKGLAAGCGGILCLIALALLTGAVQWDVKIPSYAGIRFCSNLLFTSAPEEGFYRGFIQKTLCDYLKKVKGGNIIALILSSLLFALSHIYWSPNVGILVFTFLTGLLYGGVYLFSGKIESAILCHFLFNVIHMTFFSYHAM
ncbi:MAG: CPBP family intramembrane metalloprotease [Candidatus Rhabdochlamydia sp.]